MGDIEVLRESQNDAVRQAGSYEGELGRLTYGNFYTS